MRCDLAGGSLTQTFSLVNGTQVSMPTTGVAVYSTNIDGIGYRINVQGVGFLPRTITTNSTTINGAVTDTYSIGMPLNPAIAREDRAGDRQRATRRVCMR